MEGELEPLHGRVVDRDLGRVDHIMAVHSINPRGLAAHDGLYRSAMAGTGTLRKVERELIAYVVRPRTTATIDSLTTGAVCADS